MGGNISDLQNRAMQSLDNFNSTVDKGNQEINHIQEKTDETLSNINKKVERVGEEINHINDKVNEGSAHLSSAGTYVKTQTDQLVKNVQGKIDYMGDTLIKKGNGIAIGGVGVCGGMMLYGLSHWKEYKLPRYGAGVVFIISAGATSVYILKDMKGKKE